MNKFNIERSYLLILLPCILFLGALAQELHDFTDVRNQQGNAEYHSKTHCSRERSRIAWKIIDEYLMPFVEEENYNLSRTCRLHAANDMFREQELHKDHSRINEWQCGFCQKIFLSENYLEQHFDNRHQNLLNISRGNCLADMCGALHCDVMDKSKPPKTKCNLAAVDKNRHLCESLANTCFPTTEGPSARRLHGYSNKMDSAKGGNNLWKLMIKNVIIPNPSEVPMVIQAYKAWKAKSTVPVADQDKEANMMSSSGPSQP